MLEKLETKPNFLNLVIPSDEIWFFQHGPEPRRQSEEWNTPDSLKQKKTSMSKSKADNVHYFLKSREVVLK